MLQLSYVYNQILSVLTYTQLSRIMEQRRNYDLRRLLAGKKITIVMSVVDVDYSNKINYFKEYNNHISNHI